MAQLAASGHPPASDVPMDEEKTDNFLLKRVDPQWGQGVPDQSLLRTSTSLSFLHFPQVNS
jgi:hypothetical protein